MGRAAHGSTAPIPARRRRRSMRSWARRVRSR
jgi:hypothetical protein